MRVENKQIEWFTLPELKERDANGYERALDKLRVTLWDGGWPRDDVAEEIVYAFGERVGDTTVSRYGVGDYPGVAGVELQSWAVQDRNAHVGFNGTIYPDDAPGLPWHEWLDHVTLRAGRSYTEVVVVDSDEAPYIAWQATSLTEDQQALVNVRHEMSSAVWEALNEALAAGEKQAEYLESEENLLELAQANEWEFDIHGEMA